MDSFDSLLVFVNNVNLYQGKWWWAAGILEAVSQALNYSLALPPSPAPSLSCLKEGVATLSLSCLGGGWSSVGDTMVLTS